MCFGNVGFCLPWRQLEFVQCWWQNETWSTSLQSCLLQSCVLPWSEHCCLLVRLLFWESGKLSKRFIFKYLLNRGRDDSLQNPGKQAGADGLCTISILVTFSRCCVVLLCGNNLWHIEGFEHWSSTFMVNYSYSVAVLEETKMHCSSETQVPIWDFECESALLNLGFARSFKVSRFVNIFFLPWIFWNKSLFFFFWIVAVTYGGCLWSGVSVIFVGVWILKCCIEALNCLSASLKAVWWKAPLAD